ncbi:putative RING finger protein [Trichinella spiralis]|uniref:RING finger protein n=1 Tax=Trichinella spiralis TaxID=6334 RepID=A0ABR3KW64_TRISP
MGGFIAAALRLPQLDLQLATPPYSHGEKYLLQFYFQHLHPHQSVTFVLFRIRLKKRQNSGLHFLLTAPPMHLYYSRKQVWMLAATSYSECLLDTDGMHELDSQCFITWLFSFGSLGFGHSSTSAVFITLAHRFT